MFRYRVSLKADHKTARPQDNRTLWKTGQPPNAALQLLHFSPWRRKYVGLPNSDNIN